MLTPVALYLYVLAALPIPTIHAYTLSRKYIQNGIKSFIPLSLASNLIILN
jgi:hypothetical protein